MSGACCAPAFGAVIFDAVQHQPEILILGVIRLGEASLEHVTFLSIKPEFAVQGASDMKVRGRAAEVNCSVHKTSFGPSKISQGAWRAFLCPDERDREAEILFSHRVARMHRVEIREVEIEKHPWFASDSDIGVNLRSGNAGLETTGLSVVAQPSKRFLA